MVVVCGGNLVTLDLVQVAVLLLLLFFVVVAVVVCRGYLVTLDLVEVAVFHALYNTLHNVESTAMVESIIYRTGHKS